ncbi:MAG: hypothetical protein ABJ382_05750 [Ilumatobacter sp.]
MESTFRRRTFLVAALAAPALGLLAACGSDSTGDSVQSSNTTDSPPGTNAGPISESPDAPPETAPPPPPTTEPPADAEQPAPPILSYTTPGGFTTSQFAFQDPPIVLVSADRTLIGPGVSTAIFPGPLLPVHQVQTVTPAGVDALIAAADAAGLLTDADYSTDAELVVADAATSVLTITVDGTTYRHEAYALGIGGGPGTEPAESTPERQALLEFLTTIQTDPSSIFGDDNLGGATVYEPTAYQFIAMSMAGADIVADATVVEWPSDTGIDLASATECVELDRAVIGDLFEDATQLTFFVQDGENYVVTPRPAYPGRSC